jgi:hypothetical protein
MGEQQRRYLYVPRISDAAGIDEALLPSLTIHPWDGETVYDGPRSVPLAELTAELDKCEGGTVLGCAAHHRRGPDGQRVSWVELTVGHLGERPLRIAFVARDGALWLAVPLFVDTLLQTTRPWQDMVSLGFLWPLADKGAVHADVLPSLVIAEWAAPAESPGAPPRDTQWWSAAQAMARGAAVAAPDGSDETGRPARCQSPYRSVTVPLAGAPAQKRPADAQPDDRAKRARQQAERLADAVCAADDSGTMVTVVDPFGGDPPNELWDMLSVWVRDFAEGTAPAADLECTLRCVVEIDREQTRACLGPCGLDLDRVVAHLQTQITQ